MEIKIIIGVFLSFLFKSYGKDLFVDPKKIYNLVQNSSFRSSILESIIDLNTNLTSGKIYVAMSKNETELINQNVEINQNISILPIFNNFFSMIIQINGQFIVNNEFTLKNVHLSLNSSKNSPFFLKLNSKIMFNVLFILKLKTKTFFAFNFFKIKLQKIK